MSYILTNPSALSALQSLQQTQNNLATVQNEVSTGLSVASAKDNASYWSIATQLNSDSGVITAANSALTQSQSVLDTASSAITSVITTINSIQTALTQAAQPGADIANINTTLAALGNQLTDAVNGASFNGLNLLNGSQAATLNFIAGFNATASGGTFNTISLTPTALTGTAGTQTTSSQPTITDAATINQIISQTSNGATLAYGTNVITATAGTAPTYATTQDGAGSSTTIATAGTGGVTTAGTAGTLVIQSEALNGATTTTTYTAVDGNGNGTSLADAAALQVSVTTTTAGGALTQTAGGQTFNLTTLGTAGNGITSATAAAALSATEQALTAVTNYAATIGATQDRVTNATNLNTQLTTNYATGVAGLVDANMNTASTQLQALQTQEQLGIQSLSIANQQSQLILKLFG
jgi:flagellin